MYKIKTAFRYLRKQRFASAVQILTTGIGITFILIIGSYIQTELSYDRFHEHKNQIYRAIYNLQFSSETVNTPLAPPALGPGLAENSAKIQNFVRIDRKGAKSVTYEKSTVAVDNIVKTDNSFFDIFSFELKRGQRETALASSNSAVISETTAQLIFGDNEPIGSRIEIQEIGSYQITGIIQDSPQNSHIKYDILLPFDPTEQKSNEWFPYAYHTYLQINSTDIDGITNEANAFIQQQPNPGSVSVSLQPLNEIYLYSNFQRDIKLGNIKNVYSMAGALLLVLAIIYFNFSNLVAAHALSRMNDQHVKKILGASRSLLLSHYIVEALLIVTFAFAGSILCYQIITPYFDSLVGKTLSIQLLNSSPVSLLLLFFIALLTVSYAALNIKVSSFIQDNSKSIFRKILVTCQFIGSITLIASTMIILQQTHYLKNKSLGYEKENIISIPLSNETVAKYDILRASLLKDSSVLNVCAASDAPITNSIAYFDVNWQGKNPNDKTKVNEITVDKHFVNTFGLHIIAGKNFSEYSASLHPYLINKTLAEKISSTDVIGKKFYNGIVHGVFKDFHYHSLYNEIEPLFLKLTDSHFNFNFIFVKINATNTQQTIDVLRNAWIEHTRTPFQFSFLDDDIDRLYNHELRTSTLVTIMCITALIISCIGLIGLVQFELEKRIKEIGIRKVVGATTGSIVLHFNYQYTKWIAAANLFAWPIAYFTMKSWLCNFPYQVDMSPWIFVIAGISTLAIAMAAIGILTIKAATAKTVDSLKYE
jgi:putative ABC transport system permease protein